MAALKVTGIARMTRDAQVKNFKDGLFCEFGIVVYRTTIRGRETQDHDFFDVTYWTKDQSVIDTIKKGRLIYIEDAQLFNERFKVADKECTKIKLRIKEFNLLDNMEQENNVG